MSEKDSLKAESDTLEEKLAKKGGQSPIFCFQNELPKWQRRLAGICQCWVLYYTLGTQTTIGGEV